MLTPCCGRAYTRVAFLLPGLVLAFVALYADATSAQTLTLMEAFQRATAFDAGLPAAAFHINAAEAGIRQADRAPNPQLSFTAENFVSSGSTGGLDRNENTLVYQQIFERGGKREARVSVARSDLDVAQLRHQIHALDLYEAIENAWVEALSARADVALYEERLAIAERLFVETERRVEAARDPLLAGARVAALVAEAESILARSRSVEQSARAALATYWNGTPDFELDPVALETVNETALSAAGAQDVDLALLEALRGAAAARVGLEESRAVQDPTFQGGIRHFALNDDFALVAGVSIPLPLHDDNSGNVARAGAQRRAAEQELVAARIERQREIAVLRSRISASAIEALALQNSAIPQAERALELAHDGFGRGGFGYIDVIEAERALSSARARRLEALKTHHLDLARVNRLTGRHAFLIPNEGGR